MNFAELRRTVADSDATEWHRILRQGPTYRNRFGSWSSPREGTSGIETDSHLSVAVYKPDIDLTLAYGMPEQMHREELSFEWSKNFADDKIREISIADVFWRGSLVDRVNYVYVDGARGILPMGEGNAGLNITRYEWSVAFLLSEIEGLTEFERYYAQVPFVLTD